MAEIILTFENDGKTVHKETKGFVGKSCVEETKFLEEALGTPANRKYKSEYYETEDNTAKIKVRSGGK